MNRFLFLLSAVPLLLAGCKDDRQNMLGLWKGADSGTSFRACSVTKAPDGSGLHLRLFTTYTQDTKAVDWVTGYARPMHPGDTVTRKAGKLTYDGERAAWIWKAEKDAIPVRLADKDHLILDYPFDPEVFTRAE